MPKKDSKKKAKQDSKKDSGVFHLSGIRLATQYKKERIEALEAGKKFPTFTEYKKKLRK